MQEKERSCIHDLSKLWLHHIAL